MQFEELLMKKQKQGREEGREEGIKEGIRESLKIALSNKGKISSDLEEIVKSETNVDILKEWLDKALKITSIDEFEKEILCK